GPDDECGPAGASGLYEHGRGLQRLLRIGKDDARGIMGPDDCRPENSGDGCGQGVRRPKQSATRVGPLGGQVLNAGNDGYGPQPWVKRRDCPGPGSPDYEREVCI